MQENSYFIQVIVVYHILDYGFQCTDSSATSSSKEKSVHTNLKEAVTFYQLSSWFDVHFHQLTFKYSNQTWILFYHL